MPFDLSSIGKNSDLHNRDRCSCSARGLPARSRGSNSERVGIRWAMLPPLRPIECRAAKEVSMDEVFPVLAGIALGLATLTLRGRWRRIAVIGILGVALGFVASWISGELIVSRLYVLVDAAQVIVAAYLTGLLVPRWLRRRARSAA